MTNQLRRVRWGIRAVLVLGLLASTTANVLHAADNLISQCIAAWPVLALYLTIEVISRVPVHRRSVAAARMFAAAVIAGIAAWVSYWHMAGVASRYGETGASPYLLPLSVDGLIVVASICLVELGGRIRTALEENGESNGEEGRVGQGLPEDAGPVPGIAAEGEGAPRQREEGAAGREEEVAAGGVNLTRPRKPHPTAKAQVEAAHKQTPKATPEALAKRLNLSLSTVKRYRPKPADETPMNGHALVHAVRAENNEKEN